MQSLIISECIYVQQLFDYSAMKNIIPENQIDDEFYVTNTKDSFFKVKTIEGNNCIYHEFTKIKPSEELL